MMEVQAEALSRSVAVALGRRAADVVFTNFKLVDVLNSRLKEGLCLALAGEIIAWIGPVEEGLIGPETRQVDLQGGFMLPGLIDPHTHLDSIWRTSAFVERALPFGNTTCITETAMMASALGKEGVRLYMDEASNLPMRIFFLAPPLVPPYPELETSAGLSDDEFAELMNLPLVMGMGESYWNLAVAGEERALKRLAIAQSLNKTTEGHSAGASGRRLAAYRAAGVQSCHEPTSLEEARQRMELGLAVQIREGYIRREMAAVLPGLTQTELDSGLVMLSTDVGDSGEMVTGQGGMNLLLAKAVELGIDPIRAVRLASLFPARHFNLRRLGALSPGNLADLMVVEDLEKFKVQQVWTQGRRVARDGRMCVQVARHEYPEQVYKSIPLKNPGIDDLALRARGSEARVRIITLAGETITREKITAMPVDNGLIQADPSRDILKIAHFDRRGAAPPAIGLVQGLGLSRGAVATSLIWDTNNVMVVGTDDEAMLAALNRLLALGGGFVVWNGLKTVAELPLPIGGIISELSLEDLVEAMAGLERACRELGWKSGRPFLTVQTLCFTGLPFIRLTDRGLADIKSGRLVEVVIND